MSLKFRPAGPVLVTTGADLTFSPWMPLIDEAPGPAPDIYRGRFESCFREHHARLLAFAMRRVLRTRDSEDVVADAFAVAWRRRD